MSFSFGIEPGPVADFEERARAAREATEAVENDHNAVEQLASDTCEAGITAAAELVSTLAGDREGQAGGLIHGHHPTSDNDGCGVSISVNFTPVQTPTTVSDDTEAQSPIARPQQS